MMESRNVAICGVGRTDDRRLWQQRSHGKSAWELAQIALERAIADWGGDRAGIDGLLTSRLGAADAAGREAAELLGLPQARLLAAVDGRGRFCAPALLQAAQAVASGEYNCLALVYANDGRSRRQVYGGQADPISAFGDRFGFTSPGAWLGAAWRRYCHLYGADDRTLAALACSARRAAAADSCSVGLPLLTEEDYFSSPFVTEPLRRPDYCLVNDGAVALIISRMPGAGPAVWLRGGAVSVQKEYLYTGEDLFYGLARQTASSLAQQGWDLQGNRPDLLAVYDNFTPNIVLALEGFGLSRRGQAGEDLARGLLPPLNPGGGMLAGSYMQGWNLLLETVLQLRGQAGTRQLPYARCAAYLCTAALVSALWLDREAGPLPAIELPQLPEAESTAPPEKSGLSDFFWQACREPQPRLLLQQCRRCGSFRCPPAACCPHCGSEDFSWQQAAGTARLWSWNRFHKAYFSDRTPPYDTVLVKLTEGPVIVSALTEAAPGPLGLDAELMLVFEQGRYLFRPRCS